MMDKDGNLLRGEKHYWNKIHVQRESIPWDVNLARNYGPDAVARYDELLKSQYYACAICYTDIDELKEKLHQDHNHSTGKIRGLLCRRCNLTLGLVNDSIPILERSIRYLKDWE